MCVQHAASPGRSADNNPPQRNRGVIHARIRHSGRRPAQRPYLGQILIWLLVGCGLYFTVRLGLIQFRHFGLPSSVLKGSRQSDDSGISSFQALPLSGGAGRYRQRRRRGGSDHARRSRRSVLDVGDRPGGDGDRLRRGDPGPSCSRFATTRPVPWRPGLLHGEGPGRAR